MGKNYPVNHIRGPVAVEETGGPSREYIINCLSDPEGTKFRARYGGYGTAAALGVGFGTTIYFLIQLAISPEAQKLYQTVLNR